MLTLPSLVGSIWAGLLCIPIVTFLLREVFLVYWGENTKKSRIPTAKQMCGMEDGQEQSYPESQPLPVSGFPFQPSWAVMKQQYWYSLLLWWLLVWCTKHHLVWNCSLLHSIKHKWLLKSHSLHVLLRRTHIHRKMTRTCHWSMTSQWVLPFRFRYLSIDMC